LKINKQDIIDMFYKNYLEQFNNDKSFENQIEQVLTAESLIENPSQVISDLLESTSKLTAVYTASAFIQTMIDLNLIVSENQ
jgi:hypothetical protein